MAKSKAGTAMKKAAVKGKTTVTTAATKRAASNGSGSTTSPLEKFFTDQLKDIYYAEQQMLKALEQMEEAATSEELKEAFSDHRHQTQKHVKRLEKVFEKLRKPVEGKQCEAMDGLISEAQEIIRETPDGSMTRDAALIVAAQKVEHYEIATYGGLVQLALTILKYFPDASYELIPMTTEQINAPAARPLQGGLKNKKFMTEYPDFRFSTVDDYVSYKSILLEDMESE